MLKSKMKTKTKYKFLTGILPANFQETVYEDNNSYICNVKGERLSDEKWDNLAGKIKEEFGKNLIEIYSVTCYGVNFNVYLRKHN